MGIKCSEVFHGSIPNGGLGARGSCRGQGPLCGIVSGGASSSLRLCCASLVFMQSGYFCGVIARFIPRAGCAGGFVAIVTIGAGVVLAVRGVDVLSMTSVTCCVMRRGRVVFGTYCTYHLSGSADLLGVSPFLAQGALARRWFVNPWWCLVQW